MNETTAYRQLRRSRSDRMVAGVSGGLGRYFDVNPVVYRVGFVVLALLGGAGLLIYLVAALVIPDEGRDESVVEQSVRERRAHPWRLAALGLVVVSLLVVLTRVHFWDGGHAWMLMVVAVIALLALGPQVLSDVTAPAPAAGGDTPAPAPTSSPPPRRFPLATAVLGLLVLLGVVLGMLQAAGVDVPWTLLLALTAGALGLTVVIGAFLHLRVLGLVPIAVVFGAVAIVAATIDVRLDDGIGDRTYSPVSATELRHDYKLGIGELQLDLTRLELPPGQTRVAARVGAGHILVLVPPGMTVRAVSHVDYGRITYPRDLGADGRDASSSFGPPGARLLLDADMGVGEIEVERAVR